MTIRRILATVALSGALLAGGLAVPQARATKGNCDPAPDPYNIQRMTKGNDTVLIEIRYGWDGVSVYPECAGPIIRIRVTNTGDETWYAHVEGRKGQPRTIAIEPGAARNYTGAQLASVGIETLDDLAGLSLTRTP